jgi:(3S)-malyl-CoA thioesterase
MSDVARAYRSALYIPGSKERALEKAKGLACDAILFDLEDAVTPDEKANSRALLAKMIAEGDYGNRAKIVRVNGFDTDGRAANRWHLAAQGQFAC